MANNKFLVDRFNNQVNDQFPNGNGITPKAELSKITYSKAVSGLNASGINQAAVRGGVAATKLGVLPGK